MLPVSPQPACSGEKPLFILLEWALGLCARSHGVGRVIGGGGLLRPLDSIVTSFVPMLELAEEGSA
jgi:hypothetical protein